MVVKLSKMSRREIDKILSTQMLCRIAFRGTDYPYIAPFQYVYINGSLYFHFTDYGRKMKILKKDNRVCVEIERLSPELSDYSFVSLTGSLSLVKDTTERNMVIRKMAEDGREKLSPRFLAAHGLKMEEG